MLHAGMLVAFETLVMSEKTNKHNSQMTVFTVNFQTTSTHENRNVQAVLGIREREEFTMTLWR